MPIYEYRCEGCGKKFQVVSTISEHRRGGVVCPQCNKGFALLQYREAHAWENRRLPQPRI
ncbi:hypothetical protein GSbR_40570 [Geobacter sp. SVR]|nr:hypothetical protein GSVR_26820 [Geobacter sp. SVR]GCF87457.1 hypothetical protein GSbR_40570 [Geobacter sp. SVR]